MLPYHNKDGRPSYCGGFTSCVALNKGFTVATIRKDEDDFDSRFTGGNKRKSVKRDKFCVKRRCNRVIRGLSEEMILQSAEVGFFVSVPTQIIGCNCI